MRESHTTELLLKARSGDSGAQASLMEAVYDELRRMARHQMQKEGSNHTLQPTALVHEAFLRLVQSESIEFQDRAHFFAIAALVMRRILVDHARGRKALKRGGQAQKLQLDEVIVYTEAHSPEILALDEALEQLEKLDPRKSRIVEMRFFGGLPESEIAAALGISLRTVQREWCFARAWLLDAIAS